LTTGNKHSKSGYFSFNVSAFCHR